MTLLEQQRIETGRCKRCGASAAPDSNFCTEHKAEANALTKKSMATLRAELRELRLCVDCREPSETYRCRTCRGLFAPALPDLFTLSISS